MANPSISCRELSLSNSIFDQFKKVLASEAVQGYVPRLRLLFRPHRWKYVKKIEKDSECVFCKAARQELALDTLCVYKTHYSMVVLNKFPYNSGHLLVIPLRHQGDLLALTQAEYEDLHNTLRLAVKAAKEVYTPHGINVGLNLEKAAGAGLPDHLHYHVIPRFIGDLNFFPLIAESKVIPEALEDCYKKYFEFFRNV